MNMIEKKHAGQRVSAGWCAGYNAAIDDMTGKTGDGCEWCQPNEDGEYSMLAFQNPTNPAQQATVSFYNGTFAVELKLDNETKPARISAEIKFCPFCGRRFESEGTV